MDHTMLFLYSMVSLKSQWSCSVFYCTITIILCMLMGGFFVAGAIGMAKEATEAGRTDISHMIEYGKRIVQHYNNH